KQCGYKYRSKNPSGKKGKRYKHLDRAEIRKCLNCNKEFKAINDFNTNHGIRKQLYCSHRCYLISRRISYFEIFVGEYLENQGLKLNKQFRIKRWCFDFAIKNSNILIEADGHYWHSLSIAKERDVRKNEWCRNNKYELYRIDEFEFRKNKRMACDVVIKRWEDFTGKKAEKIK
ncbi:unnamed protein product, partial [marine sediment metagenome]